MLSLTTPLIVNANDSNYHSDPEKISYESLDFSKREISLMDNWKFYYGAASGAEELSYNDSSWRNLSLPHDYSLELNYDLNSGEAESGYKLGGIGWYRKHINIPTSQQGKRFVIYFDGVYNNAEVYINGNLLGVHPYGYTPFAFDLTPYIQYGADNLLAVKVNHQFPSSRWYSGSGIYRPVKLIVTNDVFVDLYGVKITNSDFDPKAVGVVTTTIETAIVNNSDSDKKIEVKQSLLNNQDQEVASKSDVVTVTSHNRSTNTVNLDISSPTLWSLDNPYLYKVKTELLIDGQVVDTVINNYGFRKAHFDRNNGFSLNGDLIKLQGVSMHHDQGALGSRAFKDAIERQVDILKDMGVNAIRVTHNPASEVLIEVANRKGMLLIEEFFDTWFKAKNGNSFDYSKHFNVRIDQNNKILNKDNNMTWWQFDTLMTVKRGINSPAIIAWSLGNELQEGLSNYSDPNKLYENMGRTMSEWVYSIDRSRLVTFGDNKIKNDWKNVTEIADNIASSSPNGLGLIGFNYADGGVFDKYFNNKSNWILYASETSSAVNSRGVYNRLRDSGRTGDQNLTSYDTSRVGWGHMSAQSWYMIIQRDYMAGEFVWTGFDYLGEPTHWNGVGRGAQAGDKSPKSSYFGIVDLAGLPKDRYYFYRSQWNKKDTTLHLLPVWKENAIVINDGLVKVDVYTNARKVKLLFKDLNSGEWSEVGSKTFSVKTSKKSPNTSNDGSYTYQYYDGNDKSSVGYENLYLTFKVPYKAGTLKAVAYDENDREITETVGRNEITTYGNAHKLSVVADKTVLNADGSSLAYLTVSVKDELGNIVEDANVPINVSVNGNSVEFLAQDNGRQNDLVPYSSKTRNTFNGKSVVIVKSTKQAGSSEVVLSSPNLESASININTNSIGQHSNDIVAYEMVKNYYVSTGSKLSSLNTMKVYMSDGSFVEDRIIWSNLDQIDTKSSGLFVIKGVSEKYKIEVSASVNVIADIAAVLNYSTVVSVGTENLELPVTRPVVLKNGDILKVEFPVVWDVEHSNLNVNKIGVYSINGYATVMNKKYPVTASVRVADKVRIETDNVAGGAKLSQNITITSDRLAAINDGRIGMNTGSIGNENIWTNYKHSLQGEGNNNAEITLSYATNTIADKLVVYWYKDSWAATLPESVDLFYKQDEDEWTKLENVTVEVGNTQTNGGSVTKYTYSFDKAEFLHFKLKINGKQGQTGKTDSSTGKPVYYCVGIGELELYGSSSELVFNSSVLPVGSTLNGTNLFEDSLDEVKTVSESAAALWVGDNLENVAITKLPIYDGKQIFYLESENHKVRKKLVVNLNQPEAPLKANDASRDIDPDSMEYNVVNFAKGNETDLAFDNNLNTIWHSDWRQPALTDEQRYIEMVLDEPTRIEALRYHKRISGGDNGTVKRYSIKVVKDGMDEFEEVATGSWDASVNQWQQATFSPVVVKKIRLYGVETVGDGGRENHFMSAAEIRVRKTKDNAQDLNLIPSLSISIEGLEPKFVDGTEGRIVISNNQSSVMPNITVSDGNRQLIFNKDYVLDYQDVYGVGIATVKIIGLGNYKGEIIKKYEIYSPLNIENNILVNNKKASVTIVSDNDDVENKQYAGYSIVLNKAEFVDSLKSKVPSDYVNSVDLDSSIVYSIKLLNPNNEISQPVSNTSLKISLPIENEFKKDAKDHKLIVLHYHKVSDDNLQVEKIDYTYDENTELLTVNLNKLSEIVILKPVSNGTDSKDNSTNNVIPDNNDNKVVISNNDVSNNSNAVKLLPNTGVDSSIYLIGSLMIVLGISILFKCKE